MDPCSVYNLKAPSCSLLLSVFMVSELLVLSLVAWLFVFLKIFKSACAYCKNKLRAELSVVEKRTCHACSASVVVETLV